MRHVAILGVILATAVPSLAAAAGQGGTHGPNLVANPGFERGDDPWRLPPGNEVVQGKVSRTGDRCLHVTRTDPGSYRLASQVVPCEPGRRYRFSVWVKTRDVKGDDSGATVCMEWSGKEGYLGGAHPPGRKGTHDWFRISGITPPVPDEATHVRITLYLRKRMTGEAWFDDVSVREDWGRPMEAFLLDPPYRGLIFAGGERRPVRVHIDLARRIMGHPWKEGEGYAGLADLALVCRLVADGRTIQEKRMTDLAPRALEVELDAGALAVGPYRVEVALERGGKVVARQSLAGRVLPKGDRPRVTIDRAGRTIVRGRPFFPLGFYMGKPDEKAVKTISRAGFNCIMPYAFSGMAPEKTKPLLDMAHRHGVMVIYSLKDLYPDMRYTPKWLDTAEKADARVREIVERQRSHPAVLAWYLNDELPPSWRGRLEARYHQVRRLDPDHPTWAVLYQANQLAEYRHTCDVLGTDPYPVARKPITMAAEWARKTGEASLGTDAFWQVPQAFAWGACREPADAPKNRPPTYREVRVMTYLALIEGAGGLIYYAWHHLDDDSAGFESRWRDMSRIGREVRALEPALLSTDSAPADLEVQGARWAAFRDGRRVWILVANPSDESATVRIRFGGGIEGLQTMAGKPVPVEKGSAERPLQPLACETLIAELP